ncbi:spx domain-containing protein, partial [Cystoisospora suis]
MTVPFSASSSLPPLRISLNQTFFCVQDRSPCLLLLFCFFFFLFSHLQDIPHSSTLSKGRREEGQEEKSSGERKERKSPDSDGEGEEEEDCKERYAIHIDPHIQRLREEARKAFSELLESELDKVDKHFSDELLFLADRLMAVEEELNTLYQNDPYNRRRDESKEGASKNRRRGRERKTSDVAIIRHRKEKEEDEEGKRERKIPRVGEERGEQEEGEDERRDKRSYPDLCALYDQEEHAVHSENEEELQSLRNLYQSSSASSAGVPARVGDETGEEALEIERNATDQSPRKEEEEGRRKRAAGESTEKDPTESVSSGEKKLNEGGEGNLEILDEKKMRSNTQEKEKKLEDDQEKEKKDSSPPLPRVNRKLIHTDHGEETNASRVAYLRRHERVVISILDSLEKLEGFVKLNVLCLFKIIKKCDKKLQTTLMRDSFELYQRRLNLLTVPPKIKRKVVSVYRRICRGVGEKDEVFLAEEEEEKEKESGKGGRGGRKRRRKGRDNTPGDGRGFRGGELTFHRLQMAVHKDMLAGR